MTRSGPQGPQERSTQVPGILARARWREGRRQLDIYIYIYIYYIYSYIIHTQRFRGALHIATVLNPTRSGTQFIALLVVAREA